MTNSIDMRSVLGAILLALVLGFSISSSAWADAKPPSPGYCNIDLDVSTQDIFTNRSRSGRPDKRGARLDTEIWCATPSTVIAVPKVTRRGVGKVTGGKPCTVVSPTKCHTISAFMRGGRIPRKYQYSVIASFAAGPGLFWFAGAAKIEPLSFTSSHCVGYGTPLLECYYTYTFYL